MTRVLTLGEAIQPIAPESWQLWRTDVPGKVLDVLASPSEKFFLPPYRRHLEKGKFWLNFELLLSERGEDVEKLTSGCRMAVLDLFNRAGLAPGMSFDAPLRLRLLREMSGIPGGSRGDRARVATALLGKPDEAKGDLLAVIAYALAQLPQPPLGNGKITAVNAARREALEQAQRVISAATPREVTAPPNAELAAAVWVAMGVGLEL